VGGAHEVGRDRAVVAVAVWCLAITSSRSARSWPTPCRPRRSLPASRLTREKKKKREEGRAPTRYTTLVYAIWPRLRGPPESPCPSRTSSEVIREALNRKGKKGEKRKKKEEKEGEWEQQSCRAPRNGCAHLLVRWIGARPSHRLRIIEKKEKGKKKKSSAVGHPYEDARPRRYLIPQGKKGRNPRSTSPSARRQLILYSTTITRKKERKRRKPKNDTRHHYGPPATTPPSYVLHRQRKKKRGEGEKIRARWCRWSVCLSYVYRARAILLEKGKKREKKREGRKRRRKKPSIVAVYDTCEGPDLLRGKGGKRGGGNGRRQERDLESPPAFCAPLSTAPGRKKKERGGRGKEGRESAMSDDARKKEKGREREEERGDGWTPAFRPGNSPAASLQLAKKGRGGKKKKGSRGFDPSCRRVPTHLPNSMAKERRREGRGNRRPGRLSTMLQRTPPYGQEKEKRKRKKTATAATTAVDLNSGCASAKGGEGRRGETPAGGGGTANVKGIKGEGGGNVQNKQPSSKPLIRKRMGGERKGETVPRTSPAHLTQKKKRGEGGEKKDTHPRK